MNQELYQFIVNKEHHAFRETVMWDLAAEYAAKKTAPIERMTDRFDSLMRAQTPHIFPGQKIVFMRSVANVPAIFTDAEWEDIRKNHYIHELGFLSNLSPDYEMVIRRGLDDLDREASPYARRMIAAIYDLADRYAEEAAHIGRDDITAVLHNVPRKGATTFREALQFFRILHYSLWMEGDYHVTVGRFDQYMDSYLENDLKNGTETEDSALELLTDFYLSFNIDSDLYPGVQQGDNGQSMVLGGKDTDGGEIFNTLTRLALKASGIVKMIDPKINLRVSKDTPMSVFELGSELTKVGLGFPQYSNDDVIIPGLEKLGYAHEDAVNYAIAACWEFIIPHVGADIANIGALSMPKVIDTAVHQYLAASNTFDTFKAHVATVLKDSCDAITAGFKNVWFIPSPLMGLLCDNTEVWNGGKYNNFGIHGTGVATAADSLAAIKQVVYDDKTCTAAEMIHAIDTDFDGQDALLNTVRFHCPKMGLDDDKADQFCLFLMNGFAEALEGKINSRGGHFRAGTGSAMYYLWHANELGASPDGRRKGEPFGTNFSASLFAPTHDPIQVVNSFTKPDFTCCCNGGPLTLEFFIKMFDQPEGVKKLSQLVHYFVQRGGHQMQLNAVNINAMKDAQQHPDQYRHLIVRVWGWSAYFVELDKEYQDQVISRQEYAV